MTKISIDEVDLRLIMELQVDCKQSVKQLAQKVNLSITPVRERIRRLETNGVIDKYVAVVNPILLGKNLTVYCGVTLTKHQAGYFKRFEKFVATLDEVEEIIYLTGTADYLLKIVLKDIAHFENFVVKKISKLDIISHLQSSIVIHQTKKIITY